MSDRTATILILIDGFRPDYLKQAPFMERLSSLSLSGSLIPPFGFMSTSGAIFAGLPPEASGLSHKFCLNREDSPFRFVKSLPPFLKRRNPLEPAGGLGKMSISLWLRLKERGGALSYYGSSEMIPPLLLPFFDFGQKKRPDQEGFVPSASLFEILKKEEKKWLYLGFARPRSFWEYGQKFVQKLVLKRFDDDQYLIGSLKRFIKGDDYDFIYLHLNLLDSLGHCFGTASPEMEEGIKIMDRRIEELYNLFKTKYPSLNLILVSDHGMTAVKGSIDIWKLILKFKLKIGRDFIPFLDATMARFWGEAKALDYIKTELAGLKGGRFLNSEDLAQFKIRFRDNRYGDLFWVCEEGLVLSPNFFDEVPIRGAHGYLPGTKSDYAFFLLNGTGLPSGPAEVGRKTEGRLEDIFPTILKLMKLPIPSLSSGRVL